MMKVKLRLTLLAGLLILQGCLYSAPPNGPAPVPNPVIPPDESAVRAGVSDSLLDASHDDCVQAYGLFMALARYIDRGHQNIKTTPQLFELWKSVLDNAGWAREKYPALTDHVEAELKLRGFEDPQPMEDVKNSAVEIFSWIALGCKDAAEAKKDANISQ